MQLSLNRSEWLKPGGDVWHAEERDHQGTGPFAMAGLASALQNISASLLLPSGLQSLDITGFEGPPINLSSLTALSSLRCCEDSISPQSLQQCASSLSNTLKDLSIDSSVLQSLRAGPSFPILFSGLVSLQLSGVSWQDLLEGHEGFQHLTHLSFNSKKQGHRLLALLLRLCVHDGHPCILITSSLLKRRRHAGWCRVRFR